MIPISKHLMEVLTKEYGIKFGENGISRSHTSKHHYYLCESEENLAKLKSYYTKVGLDSKDIDRQHSFKRR